MPWLLTVALILAVNSDMNSVKQEPNLERRSELALENANVSLDAAREAFSSGDLPKMQTALAEAGESVDLAYQSLSETGKDPRRNPKFFKRAELKTREIVRRLDGMAQGVDFESRAWVEQARDRVAEVHDNLLKGIMSKKK